MIITKPISVKIHKYSDFKSFKYIIYKSLTGQTYFYVQIQEISKLFLENWKEL